MKNLLIVLILAFASMNCNASVWLVCKGGQAYYMLTNPDGSFAGVTTAGGCSGSWAAQILAAPPSGEGSCEFLPCNESVSHNLKENVDLSNLGAVNQELEDDLMEIIEVATGAVMILDPAILGPELTTHISSN